MKPRSSSPEVSGPLAQKSLAEPAFGALLAIAAAVVALTCAGSGAVARVPSPRPASVDAPRGAAPEVKQGLTAAATDGSPPHHVAAPSTPPRAPELRRFFSALEALERHERSESVRVLWFGDSHTSADYLTGAVRSALTRHYGSGGPGFVRLGVAPYRHDLATLNRIGRFRLEPEPPSRRSLQDDGVFGLGGIRALPHAGPVKMTVKVGSRAATGPLKFRLLFELPQGSAFHVSVGDQSLLVGDRTRVERVPGSPILRVELTAEPGSVLTVEVRKGRPRFYGVIVEGAQPGVVLDTLGIDGARVATALAWSEAPFEAEVAARRPELVTLAYGTNEAFDEQNVEAYDGQLSDLLGRLRRAAPAADCLVLGPPDALASNGETQPRVALISNVYARVAARLGCAFASGQALMGGPGAFGSWLREDPPLSRSDRIHLTPRGYRRLGELLAASVFGEPLPALEGTDKNSP
ncbi:MAG TPA: GDSL-type esterase/lipase family protein [Polyangiaceae bacterium]|nr:GDSL-type esterase/lipase family protein [Polyangiaceae bacterium]